MANLSQREFIALREGEEIRYVHPPADYNWQHYPPRIEMLGKTWEYFATDDGVPCYRLPRD